MLKRWPWTHTADATGDNNKKACLPINNSNWELQLSSRTKNYKQASEVLWKTKRPVCFPRFILQRDAEPTVSLNSLNLGQSRLLTPTDLLSHMILVFRPNESALQDWGCFNKSQLLLDGSTSGTKTLLFFQLYCSFFFYTVWKRVQTPTELPCYPVGGKSSLFPVNMVFHGCGKLVLRADMF